jgi:hypothetical protein
VAEVELGEGELVHRVASEGDSGRRRGNPAGIPLGEGRPVRDIAAQNRRRTGWIERTSAPRPARDRRRVTARPLPGNRENPAAPSADFSRGRRVTDKYRDPTFPSQPARKKVLPAGGRRVTPAWVRKLPARRRTHHEPAAAPGSAADAPARRRGNPGHVEPGDDAKGRFDAFDGSEGCTSPAGSGPMPREKTGPGKSRTGGRDPPRLLPDFWLPSRSSRKDEREAPPRSPEPTRENSEVPGQKRWVISGERKWVKMQER